MKRIIIIFIVMYLLVGHLYADSPKYRIADPYGSPALTALSKDGKMLAMIIGYSWGSNHCFVLNIKTQKLILIDGTLGATPFGLTWCNDPHHNELINRCDRDLLIVDVIRSLYSKKYSCDENVDFVNSIVGCPETVYRIFDSYFAYSPDGTYIAGSSTSNRNNTNTKGYLAVIKVKNMKECCRGAVKEYKNIATCTVRMPVWINDNTLYLSENPCEYKIIKVKLSKNRDTARIEKTINGQGCILGAWQGKCAYRVFDIDCNVSNIFVDDGKRVREIKVLKYKDDFEYFILRKSKLLGRIDNGSYTSLRILNLNGTVLWKRKIKGNYSVYDYDATDGIIYLWQHDKPYHIYKMKTDKNAKIKKIFDVASVKPLLKVFE